MIEGKTDLKMPSNFGFYIWWVIKIMYRSFREQTQRCQEVGKGSLGGHVNGIVIIKPGVKAKK